MEFFQEKPGGPSTKPQLCEGYPVDKCQQNKTRYPLDTDLSDIAPFIFPTTQARIIVKRTNLKTRQRSVYLGSTVYLCVDFI